MLCPVTTQRDGRSDDTGPRPAVEGSQTVDRALRLLELLGPGPHVAGLTVTELAQELGVGRPVIYRLVRSLEARNFIRRTTEGRYCLGHEIYRLSAAVSDSLADVAVPVLRALADAVGATAHLTVARGGEAVAVAVVEPSRR
jgi:DNA-binding IclR family transcriptional regulator